MSDLHIDDFYRDSAKILLQLYRHFPRRQAIYTEDIAGPDTPDDFGLPSDRHQACFATLLWLSEHGYLDYGGTISYDALDQAVLSHRGFTLLAGLELEQSHQIQNPDENIQQKLAASGEPALSRAQLLRYKLKQESSFRLNSYMRYILSLSAAG